ncbi:phage tail assembly chaperone [Pseudomonas laurylsulfatiphila]|uniref:phage tail assembly chaperone n=1 Tax=Pseudomonas laurylsulfatiphila TaxID=2011015 RepID=UPI003D1F40F5
MTVWVKWSDEDLAFMFADEDNGGAEISQADYAVLMQGLSAGMILVADEQGAPVLVAPPDPMIWAKWIEEDQRFLFLDSDNGGVTITLEAHRALLEGQAAGQRIVADAQGSPILAAPLSATVEEQKNAERIWRDLQLSLSDGVVSRHRDEVESGLSTTLTAEQYTALQAYRRQLRDWPENGEFPLIAHRPVAPSWLTATTQN